MSMDVWEYQVQEPSGTWNTMVRSNNPQGDNQIKVEFDNLQKGHPGKRIRLLCNGRVVDIR